MNLWLSSFGQTDLVKKVKKGGSELQMYLKQYPPAKWTKDEFIQLYEIFKQADYSKKNKLFKELGHRIILRSLDAQGLLGSREEARIKENFRMLKTYRTRLGVEGEWNYWARITNLLARNSYFAPEELSHIGGYYDEVMERWEYLDLRLRMECAAYAGNHFMGVEQNFEKAAIYYKKAVRLEKIKEQDKIPIYVGLAELYLRKKDFDRSLEYNNKILLTDSVNRFLKQQTLIRCGTVHKEIGNLTEAENYFAKVQEILPANLSALEANPFVRNSYINVYAGLLKIQLEKNNLEKAKVYSDKLEAGFQKLIKDGQTVVLILEALMEYNLIVNDTLRYLSLEQIAMDIMRQNGSELALFAPILTIRGDYWFKQKKPKLALSLYDEALSLLRNSASKELISYGQDEPHALITLTKKLKVLHWQRQQHQIEKGNHLFYQTAQEAVHLLDHIRQNLSTKSAKLKLLNNAPSIYEYALEVTWELYQEMKDTIYLEKIYSLIEKSKSMLLLEALNENAAKDFGAVPKELRTKEKNLINDLKFYKAKLIEAEELKNETKIATFKAIIFEKRGLLDQLKGQLEVEYPKYYAFKFKTNIAPLSEVQLALDAHEAQFISYFLGKRNLYICRIDGDHIDLRIEELPNNLTTNLSQDIFALRSKLTKVVNLKLFNLNEYLSLINLSHRLYLLLLKEEITKTKVKRLIVSLDGVLNYIPFEALIMEKVKPTSINFNDLPYTIKDYALSYNYTATLWLKSLELNKTLKSSQRGILGMAASYKDLGIDLPRKQMNLRKGLLELEGAKGEIRSLEKMYKGKFYIGASATENQFKADVGKYSIIHLALHGLVDNRVPMNSGLFFTENGDTTEDNILFAYELSNLDMNANLVVLSACSTGDGVYKSGEGVLSLGRGFMYAGASSIMTTLWQINDQSSQEIMQCFYKNLSKGMKKDKALQQAKLTYLSNNNGLFSHPTFWSAFILVGDIDSVEIHRSIALFWYLSPMLGLIFVGVWLSKRKK